MAKEKWVVIGPDQIPISPKTHSSKISAERALIKWKQKFYYQGYYSSVSYGRIPYNIISRYCEIKKQTT